MASRGLAGHGVARAAPRSIFQAAGEHEVKVPEELAVAGIDDIDISAHYSIQLTTVSHRAAEMAGLAVTWMMEIAQDPARFPGAPFRPPGMLLHTCDNLYRGEAPDHELIWGDYFLLEALARWRGRGPQG